MSLKIQKKYVTENPGNINCSLKPLELFGKKLTIIFIKKKDDEL